MSESPSSPPPIEQAQTWRQALAVYAQRPVIGMVFLGFSAGLPFLLVFTTLAAWLRDVELTRTAIGFFGDEGNAEGRVAQRHIIAL